MYSETGTAVIQPSALLLGVAESYSLTIKAGTAAIRPSECLSPSSSPLNYAEMKYVGLMSHNAVKLSIIP